MAKDAMAQALQTLGITDPEAIKSLRQRGDWGDDQPVQIKADVSAVWNHLTLQTEMQTRRCRFCNGKFRTTYKADWYCSWQCAGQYMEQFLGIVYDRSKPVTRRFGTVEVPYQPPYRMGTDATQAVLDWCRGILENPEQFLEWCRAYLDQWEKPEEFPSQATQRTPAEPEPHEAAFSDLPEFPSLDIAPESEDDETPMSRQASSDMPFPEIDLSF